MRAIRTTFFLFVTLAVVAGSGRALGATTTITAATGGGAISATNAGVNWTTLTGPVLAESTGGTIGTGTIILNAPSGFLFNTSVQVTVRVNGSSTASRNINNTANNGTIAVAVTASNLTLNITEASSTGSSNTNTLTWQNIQVRPTASSPLASGPLTNSGNSSLPNLTGAWGTLTEVAGPVTRLQFTNQPGGATAGAVFGTQPVVVSQDQYGNPSTNGLPAISYLTVALTNGTGVLQGTTNLNLGMSGGKGTATFTNLRLDTAGSGRQLLVTSTNGLAAALSSAFTVSPALATQLQFTTQPGGATAGAVFGTQPVVVSQDQYGNPSTNGLSATSYVTVALTNGTGVLQGTTNVDLGMSGGKGTATFANLRLDTAGSGRQLLVTSTNGLVAALSSAFTVSPALATQLQFTTQPGGATAGAVFGTQPVVMSEDQYGNPSTNGLPATSYLTVALTNGTGVLQGTTNVNLGMSGGKGTATFTNLRLDTAGSGRQLLVTSTNGLAAALSSAFTVSPALATQLQFTTQPGGATAGAVFGTQPVVMSEDQYGNPSTNGLPATSYLTVALTNGTGVLQGTTNVNLGMSGGKGTATFTNLRLDTAGSGRQLLVTSTNGLAAALSSAFTVSPALATQLQFTTQPGGATAGAVFGTQPVVMSEDQYGNPSTNGLPATSYLTVALTNGTGVLQGTTNVNLGTSGGKGTATFTNLRLDTAGSGRQLLVTSTNGLAAALSSAFTVSPGAATRLVLATQPSTTAQAGVPFAQQPVVQVQDNFTNLRTSDSLVVTAAPNPGAGALLGTTNIAAVGGVATFTNLAASAGGSMTLTFSSGSLTPATSGIISVAGFATNNYDFIYTNRQALLSDGWSFLATLPNGTNRNTEITNSADGALVSYDQTNHPGTLRIPVDTGDLWGTGNNTRNSLLHGISSNWVSLQLEFTFSPSANYQQAQLALYQDDDNYIEVGHAYNGTGLGGEAATMLYEDGGIHSSWSPLTVGQFNITASHMYLRLDRDVTSERVSGSYSLDGTNWVKLGQAYNTLVSPRVCLWVGGSSGGFPNCDLRRLQMVTSTTPLPPMLVAQPGQLVFNAVAGQPCTNLQQLRVVTRRSTVPQAYTVTSSAPWLFANAGVSTTPGYCDVGVNTAGLAAGLYAGTLTCSAPGATSAVASVTLIVNPAIPARVATWRGAKAGAMTVWIDDAQPSAFDELTANGFAGTYLLWGNAPQSPFYYVPSFFANYYLAGMELGGHTVDHLCLSLSEPATRYELEYNIAAILANTPEPSNNLISFAFPCGTAPISAQVDASDYYLDVHSYNVNQFEDATPYSFMFLKTFNSHEHVPYPPADFKPLVDAAIAQGKWFNMVLHATNNSDGAITYANGKDIWVAPGGTVSKYILQRDRTVITNYLQAAGQLSFSFYRLPLAPSSVRSFETAVGPQDMLTFQVDTTGSNSAYNITVNGNPVTANAKVSGDRALTCFDAPATAALQTAVLQPIPNRPPVLPALAAQAVSQFATLLVTNAAADADLPSQTLTYVLANSPAGAQIDGNGVIRWTPDVTWPPGAYTITTIVSDNGFPSLRATNTFAVTVQPQNWLVLPPRTNMVLDPGQELLLTNTATYTRPLDVWTTNTMAFSYTNRDALLADGWNFTAMTPGYGARNTEFTNPAAGGVISYDQAVHQGTLRIPCDIGDLWTTPNTSRNALFRSLPTNWASLRLNLSFAPTQDFQQVHLAVTQDDDNYEQVGFAHNISLGDAVITLILETNANPVHSFTAQYGITNVFLRLDQTGAGLLTGFYSRDGTNWSAVGAYGESFTNPRLSIWVGGSPVLWTNGLPSVDLRRLDMLSSNSLPSTLTYTLLNAPSGASIDTNGVVHWTPAPGQVPSANLFTALVTDNQVPPLSATNSFMVTARALLTVVADSLGRPYGATNAPLTASLTGVRPGDNITVTCSTVANAASPVGTYDIVPVLHDPDSKLSNYTVLSTNGTLTVLPAPLLVRASNSSRAYGQANPPLGATFSGFVNNESTNALGGALVLSTGAQTNSPVGTYAIVPSGLMATNYTLSYSNGTLIVTASALLVRADDQSRFYGATNPVFTGTVTGLQNGDAISASYSTSAQTNSPVGSFAIVPALSDPGNKLTNYSLTVSNGTLTILPVALLVKANNASRAYGQTNPPFNAVLSGFVNNENTNVLSGALVLSTAAQTNSPVGTYAIVSSGLVATNYAVSYSNGTLTVTASALIVKANDQSRFYGATNSVFSGTLTGLQNGDAISASYSTSAQTNSPVGGYAIVPVLSDPGNKLTNYSLTISNGTLTVWPTPLLVRASNVSRAYGQTNPPFNAVLSGFVNNESTNVLSGVLVLSTGAQTNSPVGTYAIVPSGLMATNYTLSYSNGTLTVTSFELVVKGDDQSRLYGATNPVFSGTLTGLQNGDAISASYSTSALTNSPVGAYAIVPALSDPGNKLTNYSLTVSNGTLTILPVALLVKANNASRAYGQTNPPFNAVLSGFVNNESTNVLSGALVLSIAAQTNSPVGTYAIVPSGLVATNYAVSYSNGTLTVTAFDLVVKANDQSRFYGATNSVFSGTLMGLQNGDAISASYSTSAQTNSPVGGYAIVPVLSDPGSKLTNYSLTVSNGTMTVLPAPLQVAADNASRAYGQTNPAFNAVLSGFVNSEDLNVLGGALELSTDAQTNSPVGTYAIVPSGLMATNYTLSYSNGRLTVTSFELVVKGDDQSRLYGATNPVFSGTLTGLQNGDAISASYSTSAQTNSPVGAHAIVPALSDPGNKLTNYSLTVSNGTLTVLPAPLHVAANTASRAYGQANPPFGATFSGFVNNENTNVLSGALVLSTAAQTNSPVGTYAIVPSGLAATNYAVSYSNGTLTVTAFDLVVRAKDQSRFYGATNPVFSGTVTGLQNGDEIGASFAADAQTNSPVGGYAIVPALSDPGNKLTNYSLTVSNGTMTVLPAPLQVAADNASRAYGQTNPAFNAVLSGFVNSEDLNVLGGALELSTDAQTNSPVGSYAIVPALSDPGNRFSNYSLTVSNGTLTISPAPLLVRANDASRAYGQANPPLGATFSGFVNNESANMFGGALILSTDAQTNSPVGTYAIVPSGLTATNYTLSYSNGTLTVTAYELVVRANDQSRYYGAANPVFSGTLAGLQNGDAITASFAADVQTNSPVGVYAIVPALSDPGNQLTNYSLTVSNGTLNIMPVALLVKADNASRAYGQTNPPFNAVLSGFVNNEDTHVLSGALALGTDAQANSPVGTYAIVPSGLTATNYTLGYSNGTLTVIASALLVRADNESRLYGQTNPPLTVTYTGFVNGEDTRVLSVAPSVVTEARTNSPVGPYYINISGGAAPNYELLYETGTLTVLPAPLLLKADDVTRRYGQTNPVLTATLSGLVNGEDINALGGGLAVSTPAGTDSPPGAYPIVPSGLTATNYALTFLNGTLTITGPVSVMVLTSSANPALPGSTVRFDVAVSPEVPGMERPSGVVQFLVEGTPLGEPIALSNGLASVSTSPLPHGQFAISAQYAGDANFLGCTNFLSPQQIVNTPPQAYLAVLNAYRNQPAILGASDLLMQCEDADGDLLQVVGVTQSSFYGGSCSLNGAIVSYMPAPGYTGPDLFNFTVQDPFGGSAAGMVYVNVNEPDLTPPTLSRVVGHDGGAMMISGTGVSGQAYVLQASTALTGWTSIATNSAAADGTLLFLDPAAPSYSSRFYRLTLP